MVSVASGGTADRIAARILFKVLRAGSGTPARYSSTFFGAPLPFAAELRLPDFTFFMRAMLQELPLQVHAPDHHAAVRHEKCHSLKSIRTNPPAPPSKSQRPHPSQNEGWATRLGFVRSSVGVRWFQPDSPDWTRDSNLVETRNDRFGLRYCVPHRW